MNTRVFAFATHAALALMIAAAAMPVARANAQSSPRTVDARARVLVAGQPDSASVAFTQVIRQRLQANSRSLLLIPQATFDVVLNQSFRMPETPIEFKDMREIGKLIRADLVIGLIPNPAHRDSLNVFILNPSGRTPRDLGRWPTGHASAPAIVDAIEADSAYVRVRDR